VKRKSQFDRMVTNRIGILGGSEIQEESKGYSLIGLRLSSPTRWAQT